MRLLRIYGTTALILASYLWLRVGRSFRSPERHAKRLDAAHRRNARRLHRAILGAGGLFIKVGQLISILTNFLPPEFRNELSGLQDRLPPRPYDEIATRIERELGQSPYAVFAEFDRTPIATASLAQVHVARLFDGRRVAVKVQHHDIEAVAREDLAIIRRLFQVVQWVTGMRGLEAYHPEISRMIAEELDFVAEARHITEVGVTFAEDPSVRCPVVVADRSTSRLLTTEFISGTKITDFASLIAKGLDRRALAERVVGAYCRMIFVTGVYHADPHPGNILALDDGAIAFVDFGAVGRLSSTMRGGIATFFDGMLRRDPARITDAIREMGFVARDERSGDVALKVIGYVQRRMLEEMSREGWGLGDLQVDMRSRLDALADLKRLDVTFRQLTATFQVPTDWVLLERTLLLLLGLCTELDATWNPMTVIRPYLEDVVFGEDPDWMNVTGTALKELAKVAATLPDDLRDALGRVNRGELQVRVPEITAAARLVYTSVLQLIFAIFATAAGVVAYQAYDRGRESLALWLSGICGVALVVLLVSIRRTVRRI